MSRKNKSGTCSRTAKIRRKRPTPRQNNLPQHFRATPTFCQETLSFRERSRASQPRANPAFHCMSPVVASRFSSPCFPSAVHLDPSPGSGAFAFRISRVECDLQLKVIPCCLTTGQFAGTSDNFLRFHFQCGGQSKQSVYRGISQALFDKSHSLPVHTRLLSKQIQGNAAFLPFCFQQTDDLRTDGFWRSINWHTEAKQKIRLTMDATLVAFYQNTSFYRQPMGEGLNEAK